MDPAELIKEIEKTVRAMNRAWTEQWNEEEFRNYIHPAAVAIVPTTPGRIEGRDAYVAGWRSFVESARVKSWKETDIRSQVYVDGKCAVVTYLFSISFSIGGQDIVMKGRDMLFMVNENGKWLVAADQFSPEPMAAF